jgi:hypothetical protein
LSYDDLYYYTLEDLRTIVEGRDQELRNNWEIARYQIYFNGVFNGQKWKKPQDVEKFPWEKTTNQQTTLTDNLAERIRQAEELRKKIKLGNNGS